MKEIRPHSLSHTLCQSGRQRLALGQLHVQCGREESGIEPETLWSVDDPLNLSHSESETLTQLQHRFL